MVRLRHRYVVLKVEFRNERASVGKLSANSLIGEIQKSIRDLHGVKGIAVSKSGLYATYLNPDTQMAFVRMRRSAYEIVTSAMALVIALDGESCSLRTLYTGATIRHSNIFLRQYQKRQLETKYASLTTDFPRDEFKLQMANVAYQTIPAFR